MFAGDGMLVQRFPCAIGNSAGRSQTISRARGLFVSNAGEEHAMNIVVLLIILLLLFGGGGFYVSGPLVGGGLGGLILLVLIVMFVTGRLGSRA